MHEWAPEIRVDEPLARRLIGEQFPEVEGRSFQLLGEGWDTTVYRVDERWTFRFPRKEMVIPGFRNEIAHLPTLAPLLPLPIPVPTLVGEPSDAFRWPFYGAPFLPGRELAEAGLDDEARAGLALPLAEFLRALHGIELDAELPLDPVRRAGHALPRRVDSQPDGPAPGRGPLGSAAARRGAPGRGRERPAAGARRPLSRRPPPPPSPGRERRTADGGHRLDRSLAERPGRRPAALLVVPTAREPRRVPGCLRRVDRAAAATGARAVALPVRHARPLRSPRGPAGARARGDSPASTAPANR